MRRELQMRAYSVDVQWMHASEVHCARTHPAEPQSLRRAEEDDDVQPILEYHPREAPTTSAAAEDGGTRAIPPLSSDQCSVIKGAYQGGRRQSEVSIASARVRAGQAAGRRGVCTCTWQGNHA
jgi:hypothetical protein